MNEEEAQGMSESRRAHLDWLRAERAAFERHESRVNRQNTERLSGQDFAVGSDVFMENDSFVDLDDEEPVYRGMSLAGPHIEANLYEEEPVYRSLNLGQLAVAEPPPTRSPLPEPSPAHASWAAQKRPPLLRRQNAFATRDPRGMDNLLGGDS